LKHAHGPFRILLISIKIVGSDVLNYLVVTLNGLAGIVEVEA
jgi:hypothetical protein